MAISIVTRANVLKLIEMSKQRAPDEGGRKYIEQPQNVRETGDFEAYWKDPERTRGYPASFAAEPSKYCEIMRKENAKVEAPVLYLGAIV